MKDERPLGLKELATYDSPEIVSAALGRFRRRLLIRGILIPLVAAAVIFGSRLFPGTGHSVQLQFQRTNRWANVEAPELQVGPVRVQVVEGRRLEEDPLFGVRFIASTDVLRPNERLSFSEAILPTSPACERPPGTPPGEEPPSAGIEVLAHGGSSLVEVVVFCPFNSPRATIDIGALGGRGSTPPPQGQPVEGGVPKGPGLHTQDECAVPLNSVGVCTLTKAEGTYRPFGTLTLDFAQLHLGPFIWREES